MLHKCLFAVITSRKFVSFTLFLRCFIRPDANRHAVDQSCLKPLLEAITSTKTLLLFLQNSWSPLSITQHHSIFCSSSPAGRLTLIFSSHSLSCFWPRHISGTMSCRYSLIKTYLCFFKKKILSQSQGSQASSSKTFYAALSDKIVQKQVLQKHLDFTQALCEAAPDNEVVHVLRIICQAAYVMEKVCVPGRTSIGSSQFTHS